MYPEYILKKLRLSFGYDENDTFHDEWFNTISKRQVFQCILEWEGLIGGWDGIIFGYIESIYGINLNDMD